MQLSENPLINIDHVKIKRVWQNLLGNAIKYPEYLSHLQSMFFRGTESDSKGYGLGLFIAGSILEAHDSKLEIDSDWGEGTEAYFYLQLHDNP